MGGEVQTGKGMGEMGGLKWERGDGRFKMGVEWGGGMGEGQEGGKKWEGYGGGSGRGA